MKKITHRLSDKCQNIEKLEKINVDEYIKTLDDENDITCRCSCPNCTNVFKGYNEERRNKWT